MGTPIVMLALMLLCVSASAQPRSARNLALGRPYTLLPEPNYPLSSPDPDRKLLTDGRNTSGYFWAQKTTVGWQHTRPVRITIDLGEAQPIGGMTFRTAAGVAQVEWPEAIDIYVSDDGAEWWHAGDLVALSARAGRPPTTGYAEHVFRTDRLRARGRYVAVQVSAGVFVFCDEIEVLQGPPTLLSASRTGRGVRDPRAEFWRQRAGRTLRRVVSADIEASRRQVETAGRSLPANRRRQLLGQLDAAAETPIDAPLEPTARAIYPYGPAHEAALVVRAAVWRARGIGTRLWASGAWDPLAPGDLPPARAAEPRLDLVMLGGEVRGTALNISYAGERPSDATVRVSGVPAGVTVHEVAWTATADGPPVADALPEAGRAGAGSWRVRLVPGLTRQVWLSVDSGRIPPGSHRGTVTVSVDGAEVGSVPLTVRVANVRMPARPALALGGWDYTERPTYGVTERNVEQVVAFLRRYHVDSPWANASVMPFGVHDGTGRMTTPPSTAAMDRWLARWRGARRYYVFPAFEGAMPEGPVVRRRVGDWIGFWVRHLRSRGIEPNRLGLLVADEPRTPEQDAAVVTWSRAIREVQPDVALFTDPITPDPRQTSRELLEVSTILSPQRPMWAAKRREYEAVYLPQVRAGRELAFYSCSGPVRTLDPYSYHRLQAWECFRYGAVKQAFWAFGDTGGASSWNEPTAERNGYSPQFLGPDGCTTSRHMEAVREGLYDHQTLVLLREAADAAERAGRSPGLVRDARRLLQDGPVRVTEAPGAAKIRWDVPKDRSLADRVRVEAIDLLERLKHP